MNVKHSLLAVAVLMSLTTASVYAQYGGYGYGGYGYGGYNSYDSYNGLYGLRNSESMKSAAQHQPERPTDFVAATGLFMVDVAPIVKKCKIKDKTTKAKITEIIIEYQEEFDRISFEYMSQVDLLLEIQEIAESGETPSDMQVRMRAMGEAVKQLRERTYPMHIKLAKAMADLLVDEKEARAWKIYYRNLCTTKFFAMVKLKDNGEVDEEEAEHEGENPEHPEHPEHQGEANE